MNTPTFIVGVRKVQPDSSRLRALWLSSTTSQIIQMLLNEYALPVALHMENGLGGFAQRTNARTHTPAPYRLVEQLLGAKHTFYELPKLIQHQNQIPSARHKHAIGNCQPPFIRTQQVYVYAY